ncbi:TonB-dependent receptor [Ekhidna sp. To15]|uniref:TonB-dependent receptor n=1 Tax=Ekhidna sp. To15 TaxID=3395267 RepID=UPI003F51ED6E
MNLLKNTHFLLFFLIALAGYAQTINGSVKDASTGEPIEFVTIYNLTDDVHAHSNIAGSFSLKNTAPGDSIFISMVGYDRMQFVVSEETDWNIRITPAPVELSQVVITPEINTLNKIKQVDLKLNPVNSSQEILRKVPGLFIAQHAGGGKAEQIFLRGFDIDHGTDIQITADGIPVNMVSHAHGQGYADLHFLIPETVQGVDFGKGPYYAEKGNFTTAGYVDFNTYNRINQSSVKVEAGRFNTLRKVSMIDLVDGDGTQDAYIATEYMISDGPFESPQNFNRLNLFGKYNAQIGNDLLTVQASTFQSKWDASGQIPLRAVASDQIGRFGAIDDTEGGETSRQNFMIDYTSSFSNGDFMQTKAFVSKYDFELYSNFTFFLDDPVNGDQIRQKESRTIYGIQTTYNHGTRLFSGDLTVESGVGFRYDDVNGVELSHTRNRSETLDPIALADVDEFNGFVFSGATWESGKWMVNAGLRMDQFRFEEVDYLSATYDRKSGTQSTISPKLNVIYSPSTNWQLYAKSGKGFHSNDARVVLREQSQNTLPSAWGIDLGTVYQPIDRLFIDVAYWELYLEQEFVYVGDAGIVEPSGRTKRTGVDVGINYQLTDEVFIYSNANYANPRAVDEPEGADYIPLAPTFTSIGGLTYKGKNLSGSIRYRYIKDRAANEDNSVTAEGYFLTDVNLAYDRSKWTVSLAIENVFDVEWREAQFDTESRLAGETESVSEIHFTPGVPFFLKAGLTFKF